jgi:hypothetical protein
MRIFNGVGLLLKLNTLKDMVFVKMKKRYFKENLLILNWIFLVNTINFLKIKLLKIRIIKNTLILDNGIRVYDKEKEPTLKVIKYI